MRTLRYFFSRGQWGGGGGATALLLTHLDTALVHIYSVSVLRDDECTVQLRGKATDSHE